MTQIRPEAQAPVDYQSRHRTDDLVHDLIEGIKKDRTRAAELAHLDLRELSPAVKTQLAKLLAEQLRGQIPPNLAKALNEGTADPALLGQLGTRLANATSTDPAVRSGVALNADAARAQAGDPSMPQQALQWAQFVQRATHVPGSGVQGRFGSATPKGEGTILAELLGKKLGRFDAAGLRSPKLVARGIKDLSPTQRATLMRASFGDKLATQLQEVGITDPLMFIKAGSLPQNREALANMLGMPRARLLGLLYRAELLKIGPGRNGELGIRPDFLGPLRGSGIAMLGSLGALRVFSREELTLLYQELRRLTGGFRSAIEGGRIPVKRDLLHWARQAGHKKSEILLEGDDLASGRSLGKPDASELVQAWYLENLLWSELERLKREREQRLGKDERESRQERREDRRGDDPEPGDDEPTESWVEDEAGLDLEYDEERTDRLMCFWVTDYNPLDVQRGTVRRMYVCIDPDTGAIIPQSIEQLSPEANR